MWKGLRKPQQTLLGTLVPRVNSGSQGAELPGQDTNQGDVGVQLT